MTEPARRPGLLLAAMLAGVGLLAVSPRLGSSFSGDRAAWLCDVDPEASSADGGLDPLTYLPLVAIVDSIVAPPPLIAIDPGALAVAPSPAAVERLLSFAPKTSPPSLPA